MKKLTILFVSLLILSCEDEPSDIQPLQDENLVRITQNFYIDVDNESLTIFEIEDTLNTSITYSNDSYSVNSFQNGVMILEEVFDASDNLIGYTDYTYDTVGRVTSMVSYSINGSSEYLSSQRFINYNGNLVDISFTRFDQQGGISSQNETTWTLNSEGLIIKSVEIEGVRYWEAAYENGNLSSFFITGYGDTVDGEGTFTYSDKLASEAYQKEKFRFGDQWKTNVMLFGGGNYPFKQLAETGRNYLTGYSFILASDNSEAVSLNVNYEFDNKGRLILQSKAKQFFTIPNNRILTYQYE